MARTEQITLGETAGGRGATGPANRRVTLPATELATGRSLITGKAGTGTTHTAGVVAEGLLDQGFGLLVVDVDGEYYGLKEHYEVLHCGGSDACDVRITEADAERVATIAVDRRLPVVLDLSAFDEDAADALVGAVADELFAAAKTHQEPMLVLVEALHRFLPDTDELAPAGRALARIGKHGNHHGLGLCGVSSRPAEVRPAFLDRCERLLWHRLTWNTDTKLVRRILDGEYARAVQELDDGECFLVTGRGEHVRRVAVQARRTFTAPHPRGHQRSQEPALEPVPADVKAEFDPPAAPDNSSSRVAELRDQLAAKDDRIEELESELQAARDFADLAQEFVAALDAQLDGATDAGVESTDRRDAEGTPDATDGSTAEAADAFAAFGAMMNGDDEDEADGTGDDGLAALAGIGESGSHDESTADDEFAALAGIGDDAGDAATEQTASDMRAIGDGGLTTRSISTEVAGFESGAAGVTTENTAAHGDERPPVVSALEDALSSLEDTARGMLNLYRSDGPEIPADAYYAVTGEQDRLAAYAANRSLRLAGLVEHVGRGHYDYALRARLRAERDDGMADVYARDLEQQYLD